LYDPEGRLQGGLAGLEELAQVIELNSGNDRPSDTMADEDDDPPPARDFPIRNPTESSSPSTLDSDEDMDSEPGSSDDEAMEEIAMYDELSPIPITKALPQVTPAVMPSPEDTPSQAAEVADQDASMGDLTPIGSSSDSDSTGLTSRASSRKGSRRRSRSRRVEVSVESLLPIGEQLKRRLFEENVVGRMIVSLLDPIVRQNFFDDFS